MEISKKNTAEAVGELLSSLFTSAKASKTRKVLRRKGSPDDIRKKIKEATDALKKKTASKVSNLEQKIEHEIDREATAMKNTVTQRRPLYRHN